jgi:L-lactate dehydrogenase complex protein LldG
MSDARSVILARVTDALAGARSAPVVRDYRRAGDLDGGARVDLFAARVADYRAEVVRVDGDAVAAAIAGIAGAGRFGVPTGLSVLWRPPGAVEDRALTTTELDRLDGVVTGCTVAIAETGTLVLAGRPHEGRRALTLVPDTHICLVESAQIVKSVPEAFAVVGEFATRPLTFISGPSATSDIELRRVEGVHGPRNLIVLIVEGGNAGA